MPDDKPGNFQGPPPSEIPTVEIHLRPFTRSVDVNLCRLLEKGLESIPPALPESAAIGVALLSIRAWAEQMILRMFGPKWERQSGVIEMDKAVIKATAISLTINRGGQAAPIPDNEPHENSTPPSDPTGVLSADDQAQLRALGMTVGARIIGVLEELADTVHGWPKEQSIGALTVLARAWAEWTMSVPRDESWKPVEEFARKLFSEEMQNDG